MVKYIREFVLHMLCPGASTKGKWTTDVFLIVGWTTIQAGAEHHISHEEPPKIASIKKDIWHVTKDI